jgi:hypothetical protein
MERTDVGVVWFRRDLRLNDHEPLVTAAEECSFLICLHTFCPSQLEPRRDQHGVFSGVPKTSPHRAKCATRGRTLGLCELLGIWVNFTEITFVCRAILYACQSVDADLQSLGQRLEFAFESPLRTLGSLLNKIAGKSNVESVCLYYYEDAPNESVLLEETVRREFKTIGSSLGM